MFLLILLGLILVITLKPTSLLTVLILKFLNYLQSNLHVSVSSLVAAAVVWMSELPTRLNPVILPLMASIRREQVVLWN